MNPHRRFWDELLLVVEESLAAFAGVSPDLIGHSPAIPNAFVVKAQRVLYFRAEIVDLRKDSAIRICGRQSSIKGGEEVWRADCN